MAKRLETLDPGTAVYCGELNVGEVCGVYAEGESRLAEYLAVYWNPRTQVVLLPTRNVGSIEEHGIILEPSDPQAYEDLPAFDPAKFPTVRKLH